MVTKEKNKVTKKLTIENGHSLNGHAKAETRLSIQKTYKLYIDGKFPRTESGRYYKLNDTTGNVLANVCRASRKDFRDAVVVARKVQNDWAKKSAYNKGQILYRIAETLEGRKAQFIDSLQTQGYKRADAEKEVLASIDRIVYYAGWSDKYQQIFSSVNPVESAHFNFSFPEATGIVSILAPQNTGLIGLISCIMPAIVGGNTVIILAAEKYPLTAIDFAEVLTASDVSGGVVNILTGNNKELVAHFSNHMDVNACVYAGNDEEHFKTIKTNASLNVKRVVEIKNASSLNDDVQSPYRILELQEIKTTWHPIGI
jgi:acyl-CoA reductase-like NAD-dependent aldehyde dehydrogenase